MTPRANQRVPGEAPSVRAGDKLGRFSILSEVGVGGMGRIFEAYDPTLDRKIALKVLHGSEDGHRERLVREAKALARLDHPNVVTVHDVGVHEGQLFIAMEFVRGGTLKTWLANNLVRTTERSETGMRLLLGAGRGLVAAHAAGLVHRDVKPSNILIGSDGRARVADFGIAQALAPKESTSDSHEATSDDSVLLSAESGSDLTRTATSSGTPAYMAPEQFGRGNVDAAADQFSFCVTAWETVFGVRPFAGVDARERLAAIRREELRRPEEVDVDGELEALLRRGLGYRPSDRHGRLEDLVDALSRRLGGPVAPRRRPAWRWGLAIVGVGLLGAGVAYRTGQIGRRCTGAAVAFEEVWDDDRRDSVRAAVLDSGVDFAAGAWTRLETGLDTYGDAWRGAHVEACEATQVRGEQTPEQMAEQVACLDDAKRSLNALLVLVLSGETSVIANEPALLQGLPRVEHCADARGMPTPSEQSMLDAVAQAAVRRTVGLSKEALHIIGPVTRELVEDTTSVVRAQVLLEYGRSLSEASNPRLAIEPLSEAYAVAHAAGRRQVAAAAAREVTRVQTQLLAEPDTIRTWLELAKGEGLTPSQSEEVELLTFEGVLSRRNGDRDGAIRQLERSVEVAKTDAALLPHARQRLAVELIRMPADVERAVDVGRLALREYQEEFGVDHPGVALFESNLARILLRAKEHEEADELARRALDHAKSLWGEGHVATSGYLVRLSSVQCGPGKDVDAGVRLAEAALRLHPQEEATPARHAALAMLRRCVRKRETGLAKVSWELLEVSKQLYGEKHQATVLARAKYVFALLRAPHSEGKGLWEQMSLTTAQVKEERPGWDVYVTVHIHRILTGVAAQVGQGRMALEHANAALNLLDKEDSPDPLAEAQAHRSLCSARFAIGEMEAALTECLAALDVASRDSDPMFVAQVEYTIGVALYTLGRDDEALPHMGSSVRLLKESGVTASVTRRLGSAHVWLGKTNERLERFAKAEESFRTSFELLKPFDDLQRIDAGAGVTRMVARRGRFAEARTLLDELRALSREADPFQQARLSETLGYLLHSENPRKGAREYAEALELFRTGGRRSSIERICRESPFELRDCEDVVSGPK